MSEIAPKVSMAPLVDAIALAPVEIDRMSDIRYLHGLSARRLTAGMLSEAEVEAFAEYIYAESYSARIAEIVRSGRLIGGRLDGALIGTAGWTPANDGGNVARLVGVFVSPLYARCGIGRRLVRAAEHDARQSGFTQYTIRTPVGATEFFMQLGYEIASQGVWPMGRDAALPVSFMRRDSARAPSA